MNEAADSAVGAMGTSLTAKAATSAIEEEQRSRQALLVGLVKPYVPASFYPVPAALRPWISYVFVSAGSARSSAYEIARLPDASTHVALFTRQSGGPGDSQTIDRCVLQIHGPHLRLHTMPSEGYESVGIALRPGAAQALLGAPVSAVANSIVDAESLWGAWARDLLELLASQRSTAARVALLLKALCERASSTPNRFIEDVLERCSHDAGGLCLRSLAISAGYSERHLRRKLGEELGVGAKDLLRIIRINATVTNASCLLRGWADHATRFGYCDQSHMIGEFQALLGQSPERFLRSVLEPRLLSARLAIGTKRHGCTPAGG